MKRILGNFLIALPFIALALFVLIAEGFVAVVIVFGLTALIAGSIMLGGYLIYTSGEKE